MRESIIKKIFALCCTVRGGPQAALRGARSQMKNLALRGAARPRIGVPVIDYTESNGNAYL